MSSAGNSDEAGQVVRSLQERLEQWQAWSSRNVFEKAAHRAETDGDPALAARLRAVDVDTPEVSAIEALTAQHEVSSLLAGWQWQTVHAARAEGATWTEIGQATGARPAMARREYLDKVTSQEQAAERYGWSFGMTAEEAVDYRAAAGYLPAELLPNTPPDVRAAVEAAIAEDDHAALERLQAIWWDPDRPPDARYAEDEPIPYTLTLPVVEEPVEVVAGPEDLTCYSAADLDAIEAAYGRGDIAEVQRLHAGRPILTPDADSAVDLDDVDLAEDDAQYEQFLREEELTNAASWAVYTRDTAIDIGDTARVPRFTEDARAALDAAVAAGVSHERLAAEFRYPGGADALLNPSTPTMHAFPADSDLSEDGPVLDADATGEVRRREDEPTPPAADEIVEPSRVPEPGDVVGLECPECGEDAVEQPPHVLTPYAAHEQPAPSYAHPDGEPLCPVIGPSGYEPAQPREVLADPWADEQARRAQLAQWHSDDQGADVGYGDER